MFSILEQGVLKDHFGTVGKRSGLVLVLVVAAVGPLRLTVKHLAKTKRRQVSKVATMGVLPEGPSSRLRDGEYLTDDDFQSLAGSLVSDFGWHLAHRVVVAAAWECIYGVVLVGVCKVLDTHCPQLTRVLPEVNGDRSVLTFVLMVGNVTSSTVSRLTGCPKWCIPGGAIQTSSPIADTSIAEFCSNCNPLHLLAWELLIPAPNGVRLVRYASVVAFGCVGMQLNFTYPFGQRGGAYNGSIAAILFR